jgi:ABC-type multidrug transport system, ATPase and permease components
MKKVIKNILWLYRPYWKYAKLLVILCVMFWLILIPAYSIIPVYFPEMIINTLNAGKSFNEIIKIVIIFSSVLLFIPMYEDVFNMRFRVKEVAKVDLNIKNEVYKQSLKTDYKYIDDPNYYDDYTWAINEFAVKANDVHNLILSFCGALVTISAMISIIATIGPLVIFITVLNVLLRLYVNHKIDKLEVEKDEKLISSERKLGYYNRVFYLKEYAADLKSTNLKNYIFTNFDNTKDTKLGAIKYYTSKMLNWALTSDVIYRLSMALIMLHIAYEIFNGNIANIGSYITIMLAVDRLDEYLYQIIDLIREAGKLSLYAEKIKSFFELDSIIEEETSNNIVKAEASNKPFKVEFKNVCFQYENSSFSISNLDMAIKPGEKIAIVGENGAGKSTLAKLLLRLYDIKAGDIIIDDVPIRNYDISNLRSKIGVAFQTPNIYAMPFEDNIQLYNEVNESKMKEIISQFNFDKILKKNNADMETELTKEFDENGIILSGGEAQKVGLSRIMTGDFGLIILDEPSSALDPIAEYEMNNLILDNINHSTTIIVAHRLSTIRDVDRILLVEDGNIKEEGTHDELMKLRGKYYEMFTKQSENYVR